MNILYSWDPRNDELQKVDESSRLFRELTMHTGLTRKEIESDLKEKQNILKYMLKQEIHDVTSVGRVVAWYYRDPQKVLKAVSKNEDKSVLLK